MPDALAVGFAPGQHRQGARNERLARAGLSGQHGQTVTERDHQILGQRKVSQSQFAEHQFFLRGRRRVPPQLSLWRMTR